MAKCSMCGGEFTRGKSNGYCRACHAKYMREYRPRHSALSDEQRAKANCRSYANVYLSRGSISKQPCVTCGSPESQMHHDDYSKPLDITWLCRPCHLALHNEYSLKHLADKYC